MQKCDGTLRGPVGHSIRELPLTWLYARKSDAHPQGFVASQLRPLLLSFAIQIGMKR